MSRSLWQRFSGWGLLLVLVAAVGVFWLQSDLRPEAQGYAALKLLVLLLAVVTIAVVLYENLARRWTARTRMLEQFAAALSADATDLPEEGPPELENLFRAFRHMANRVRQVLEHANLEASRRESILACMAEGVLAVDSEMKVIFCNQAFAEAFHARTPVEGRLLYEIVREPALRDILIRVLTTGTAETERLQLPMAQNRWYEARALPLASYPNHGAVIVLHDFTDIQNQEQLRKDFVADVSHELRTPLAAIRGYAETLLDGALEDMAHNRRFVEIILSHAIRLNNIASDLLVLSELDSGAQQEASPERIPVLDVIESAFLSVENAARLKSVHLKRNGWEPSFVLGHRFRLEQVLSNLLDNAVKFNRPEGEVIVSSKLVSPDRIQITVSDTGIGIPSSDLKRVFERFYRVDKARSRPAGGTGLGLPIVKEVVERMGGNVTVESQLGKGSKFILILPAA